MKYLTIQSNPINIHNASIRKNTRIILKPPDWLLSTMPNMVKKSAITAAKMQGVI